MNLAIIDLETTSLDPATGHIIEAAVQLVDSSPNTPFEPEVPWVVLDSYSGLSDPGEPIPEEITEITGITDADVAGHTIDWERFIELCVRAELVVAHNAPFDRGFIEKEHGALSLRWGCSLNQIDWYDEHRMPCRHLRHLAFEHHVAGAHGAHRAFADVELLVQLLQARDRRPKHGARTYGQELLDNALVPWALIRAVGAPFARKDVLREAGWRWSPSAKVWWRTAREDALAETSEWLAREVYQGPNGARATRGVDTLRPDLEKAYGLS